MTTSLKVAAEFNKRHDNVIQTIEREYGHLLEFKKMFRKVTYPDGYGRQQPMYLMNRDGFFMLVTGFTGKKGMQVKLAFIKGFKSMERPLSDKETPTVLTLNEALVAWFGEESGRRLAECLAHHEPQKKCVYILQLSNNTTKIGVANKNFVVTIKSREEKFVATIIAPFLNLI